MPYDFPRRRLRDTHPLDPDQLNSDVDPATRLITNLDRHNLSSNLSLAPRSDNATQDSGYYNHHHTATAFDPGFGDPSSGYANPSRPAVGGTHYLVPNSQAWSVVSSCTLSNITTGLSVFWLHAFVQYYWLGWDNSYSGSNPWSSSGVLPAHLQFMLRVDGVMVPGTLTGHASPYERVCQPWRWKSGRSGWGSDAQTFKPGPVTGYDLNLSGLGPEIAPIRLGAHVPVGPGTHTVELAVRRLDYGDRRNESSFGSGATDTDVIICGNRRLYCMDMPMHPSARSALEAIDITRLSTEELITNQRLYTDIFKTLQNAYNVVREGSLARGALDRSHLKSGVLGKSYQGISPTGAQAFNARYPGFATHTFSVIGMILSTGWWPLNESGGGTQLRTGAFTVTEACYIVVKANVHVRSIREPNGDIQNIFGALVIGYEYDDGAGPVKVVNSASEAHFNNRGIHPGGGTTTDHLEEHMDVPLLLVIDHSSAPPSRTYNFFQVYGSVIDVPGVDPVVRYRYSNISMLALRA